MRFFFVVLAAAFTAMLTACVSPPKPTNTAELPAWSGKLSVKVDATHITAEQLTSASFNLVGNADAGQLDLFNPLGGKAAQVVWTPRSAAISNGNVGRNFPDLATALHEVTGTDIPIANLFDWLQGKQNKALEASMGWAVDLARFADGRITAIKLAPLPRVELRVVLEQ